MFVVCGEALMDVFAAGDTPTGMALDARVGGSPFNVAVGLARLAQPVAFFSAISSGFLGERLMHTLRSEGVDCSTVARLDAPTTLGLVGLDAKGVPSYSFYGEGCADRLLGASALELLPASMSALQVGSFATVVQPIASTLRTLVDREYRRTPVCYDPNVRLNVEPALEPWREMLHWMLPRTHLLKISEEDLHLLRPGLAPAQFAGEALAAGVGLVVVTRGAEGAAAWTRKGEATVPAQSLVVVDTVGAGDTFQAALLTWLAERNCLSIERIPALSSAQLHEAMSFAVGAAAITCSRRGADLPRRAELP